MALRPRAPRQGTVASTAAILVLTGCLAAPVLAASDRGLLCDENRKANLDIAEQELATVQTSHEVNGDDPVDATATTIDSVAADHLLKPRVEATAREVFAVTTGESDSEEVLQVDSDDEEVAKPRLRRMSDNKLAPVRRQMYRKDI